MYGQHFLRLACGTLSQNMTESLFFLPFGIHASYPQEPAQGRTINDLGGGAPAKAGKKTQRLLVQEKNSTQQPVQRLVAEEKKFNGQLPRKKKKLNANSLPEAPPQIINGPSLITDTYTDFWSFFYSILEPGVAHKLTDVIICDHTQSISKNLSQLWLAYSELWAIFTCYNSWLLSLATLHNQNSA